MLKRALFVLKLCLTCAKGVPNLSLNCEIGRCDVWPNLFYVFMYYCLVLSLQQSNQTSHFFLQELHTETKVSNIQNENKTFFSVDV